MKTLNLVKYYNETFEDERALVNKDTGEILCKGDYYHDKINQYIDGFIHGLRYCEYDVITENTIINPKNELFNKLGFYNADADYEDYDDDEDYDE